MAVVFNNEFRDMAAEANFPFTTASTLIQDALEIDIGCFLDATIYPLNVHTAPYYIASINGNYGTNNQVELVIYDAGTLEVCKIVCDSETDTAMATDADGSIVGVIVYNQGLLAELIGKVGCSDITLTSNVAEFTAGTCFSTEADGNLFIKTDTDSYSGDVVITASKGVHFETEPTPDLGSSTSSSSSFNQTYSSTSSSSSTSQSSSSSSSSTAARSTSSISPSTSSSALKSTSSTSSSQTQSTSSVSGGPLNSSSSSSTEHCDPWDTTSATFFHYKLNDNNGTHTVVNSVGADGTLSSTGTSTVTSDLSVTGKIDRGFEFTPDAGGTGNVTYVNTVGSKALMQNPFTMAFWIKPEDEYPVYDNPADVIGVNDTYSATTKFIIKHQNAGLIVEYYVNSSGGVVSTGTIWPASPPVPSPAWKHIVVTINASSIFIYVDTVLVGSGPHSAVMTSFSPWTDPILGSVYGYQGPGYGGASADTESFNGILDDVRILNRALTDDEREGLYNEGNGTEDLSGCLPVSSSSSSHSSSSLSDSLISLTVTQYRMNDVTGNIIVNDTGSNNTDAYITSTVSAAATYLASIPGKIDKGLLFNETVGGARLDILHPFGTNWPTVPVPALYTPSFADPFTLTCWVRPSTGFTTGTILYAAANSGSAMLQISNGHLVMSYAAAQVPSYSKWCQLRSDASVITADSSTWTHIAVVVKDSDILFYVNNTLTAASYVSWGTNMSSITMNDWKTYVNSTGTVAALGRSSLSGYDWYIGGLEDFRLIAKALTTGEISSIWNGGNGTYDLDPTGSSSSGGPDPSSSSSPESQGNFSSTSESSSSFSSVSELSSSSISISESSNSSSSSSSWKFSSSSSSTSSEGLTSSSSSSSSSDSSSSPSSLSSEARTSGIVSINVYGELFTLNQPIVTINNRPMEHAWLAAHPSSAVRVKTDPDEKLIVGKSKDFGSAT